MDLIDRYQKQGFSFFPLRKRSKKPIFEWGGWQNRRPSPEEVKTWQDQKMLNQVAVVCGSISGIIVLDVDNPAIFDAWLASQKHPMPPSPTVKTGKGWHIYFRHPGGKIKNSTRQIPGADIKADGGYVVAPPSIHPEGPTYEWTFALGLDDVDLADPPAWLTDYFEREVSATVELSKEDLLGEDEDWVAQAFRGVAKGDRDVMATRLAGYYLGRGDPAARVLELLRIWNLRNVPPLSDKDLKKVSDSVGRSEAKKRVRAGVGQGTSKSNDGAGLPWDEQRQAGLQGLGDLLDIPITDIRATKTDNSIWEFVLGDEGSVVISGPQLISQTSFYSRMVSAAHMIPKSVPKSKNGVGGWKGVVKEVIRLASHMEAGPEGTALGEVQELINGFLAYHGGIEYIPENRKIPSNSSFFIIHREGEVALYVKLDQLFLQSKPLGYKLTRRQLVSLLPGLGHQPDRFKWQGQTVRAWRLNLDTISQEIKVDIFRRAGEGKNDAVTAHAVTVTAPETEFIQ